MQSKLLVTLCIILATTVLYWFWYRPKKMIRTYARILRQKGYRVLQTAFNPFQNEMIRSIAKGIELGDALHVMKTRYQNYDVVISNMLTYPKLQLIHPDLIKEFYAVDKHYDLPKHPKIVDIFSRIAGEGLVFSQGERWRRKRTILNKVFNFDFIKSLTGQIADCCDEALLEIERENPISKDGQVSYDILDLTVKMFSKVMLSSFLGGTNKQTIQDKPAGQFMKELFADISKQSLNVVNFLLGPRILRLGLTRAHRDIENRVQVYRQWGYGFIRKRMGKIAQQLDAGIKSQSKDIIKSLIIAQRTAKKQGLQEEVMQTEEQIFEEFTTFFVAGTDTTSTFAQMIIYQIARHPEVERKLRDEIRLHISSNDFSYDNLKKMAYLECIQKEVTRLYGPGTHIFLRRAIKDNFLSDIPIHKDTCISLMGLTNHYSQKYFRDPLKFIPERWQSECEELPPFVFGGFSAGARTCIGKHLAMLESKIAVIKFLQRYSAIELGRPDFKMNFKFLYGPEDFKTTLKLAHHQN